MLATVQYTCGDAREEVLPQNVPESRLPSESIPVDLTEDPALYTLSEDTYWEWLASLVEKGSVIDQELDHLLDSIYDCQPRFYSIRRRRRLQDLLKKLHEARSAIRAYEHDVEELTYVFARSEVVETNAADNAEMTLSKIKATYDRAYDLCLYKLDRISNGWITASNFLISVVMLIVTILFWMEFR